MDCDEVKDALDAYALGALDAGEREQVERHLETCAACRAESGHAAAAAAALGLAAPPHPAPRSLYTRILRQIEQDRGELQTPLRRFAVRSPRGRTSWLRPLFGAMDDRGRRRLAWLQPLAASLAVLLLLGAGIWIVRMQTQINRLQARSQTMQRGLADFESQRAALMLLASEGTVRYDMQPSNPGGGLAGAVIWNPDRHVCSVFVSGLRPAPAGESYHVWLVGNYRSWDSGELITSPGGMAEKTIDLTSMSNEAGYQIVVSLQQHQSSGSAWQPVLKAWVGIQ
jgi:hypothetical protein